MTSDETLDKPDNMHTLRSWIETAFLPLHAWLDFTERPFTFWISLKDNREKQRWFIVLIIYQYLEELKILDMYRKLI